VVNNVKASLRMTMSVNKLILEGILSVANSRGLLSATLIVVHVSLSSFSSSLKLLSGRGQSVIAAAPTSKRGTTWGSTSIAYGTSTAGRALVISSRTTLFGVISSRGTRTTSVTSSIAASVLTRRAVVEAAFWLSLNFAAVIIVVSSFLLRSAASVSIVGSGTTVFEASLMAFSAEMSLGILILGLRWLITDMSRVELVLRQVAVEACDTSHLLYLLEFRSQGLQLVLDLGRGDLIDLVQIAYSALDNFYQD